MAGITSMPIRLRQAWLTFPTLLLALLMAACSSQPQIEAPKSYALADTDSTTLGREVIREAETRGQQSGFRLLGDGLDAFASRLLLMEVAEASIDVQTYLYHDDVTSQLFTLFLLRAAERGVRVRLLIDDFGHGGQEDMLAALATHPNISVRLFNPFSSRSFQFTDFLTDYSQKSRRMHNKTFMVDNQAAIIGGRNVGDTYFSADAFTNFADMDILGFGPFAQEISESFDLYWNHSLAVPVQYLWPEADTPELGTVQQSLYDTAETPESLGYLARVGNISLLDELREGKLELEWADFEVFYDYPDKILTDSDDSSFHMAGSLAKLLDHDHSEVLIISPYFVPGDYLVQTFSQWVKGGADVTILTNSLAANDVAAVHAGYSRYREDLLNGGIELWELKPQPEFKEQDRRFGSSNASLHAKSMVIDQRYLFVGSMNLDPRSISLNTEIGAVVDSPKLGTRASVNFKQLLPNFAWRLALEEQEGWFGTDQVLIWQDTRTWPATPVSEGREPEAGWWLRFQAWFIGFLPVESQL